MSIPPRQAPLPGHGRNFSRFLPAFMLAGFCACLLGAFSPAAGAASPAGIRPDREAGRALSSRLGTTVVVYDVEGFRIIASLAYEREVRSSVIPGLKAAATDFHALFDIPAASPLLETGEPCRLVLLKTRAAFRKYVSLFEKEARPERLSPGFAAAARNAQSFYWIEPVPYAACCGAGAGFAAIKEHLFHLLGHIVLTLHHYSYRFMPPWLHEGFGEFVAVRYGGGNILYCTQGLNSALFGTGVFKGLSAWARSENWPSYIAGECGRDKAPSLAALTRKDLASFAHRDAAYAWSFVSFLIDRYPEKFRVFIEDMKKVPPAKLPRGVWFPSDRAERIFTEAFGLSIEDISSRWKEWIGKGGLSPWKRNRNRRLPAAGAAKRVRFDPVLHLEGFARWEKVPEAASAIKPFIERRGESMTPRDLDAVRAEWEEVEKKLSSGKASPAPGDPAAAPPPASIPLSGLEAEAARIVSSPAARPLTEEEAASLAGSRLPPDSFRAVVRFLSARLGCSAAFGLLRGALDRPDAPGRAEAPGAAEAPEATAAGLAKGRAAPPVAAAVGTAADLAFLEEAARFEENLLKDLARADAVFKADIYPSPLRIEACSRGRVALAAKKVEGAVFHPPAGVGECRTEDLGDRVRIHGPAACVPFDVLLRFGKNTLKRRAQEDRLGYALLSLFRGNEAAFRNEIKFVRGREKEKAALEEMHAAYVEAAPGAALLGLLAAAPGEAPVPAEPNTAPAAAPRPAPGSAPAAAPAAAPADLPARLETLLPSLRHTRLFALLEARVRGIARRELFRAYRSGRRTLPALAGYRGPGTCGRAASFVFDFDTGRELAAFDRLSPGLLKILKRRYPRFVPGLEIEPCRVEKGRLLSGGGVCLTHLPVLSGDTRITAHLEVKRRKEDGPDTVYYILFGYGFDKEAGTYVSSSGLDYLDVQNAAFRDFKHLAAARRGCRNAEAEKGFTLSLDGTAGKIVQTFDKTDVETFPVPGRRKGHVFLWLYGSRLFSVDRLEIEGTIDQGWLAGAVAEAVDRDLERIFSGPHTSAAN